MMYAVMGMMAMLGGVVQGVTGFGAGIVMLMALPFYFAIPQATAISSAVQIAMCTIMVIRYRKYVKLKDIWLPTVLFGVVCSLTISYAARLDQRLLKKAFGVFFVLLSLYYLFFNRSGKKRALSLPARIGLILLAGVINGLFGVGGPLLALYFISTTDSPQQYLGYIQACFLLNALYNSAFRMATGILTPNLLPMVAAGMAGVLVGVTIAGKIVNKLNPNIVRKLTYGMVGISGIINIIQ